MKSFRVIIGATLIAALFIGSVLILMNPSVQAALMRLDSAVFGLNNTQSSQSAVNTIPKGAEKGVVNRVIDGDTILLQDGRTIRYLYADTPETKKPDTPVQCYGQEATTRNKQYVDGATVWLVAEKDDTDRYGRSLRFVFLEGVDTTDISRSVNALLVKDGFARTIAISPNTGYKELFTSLEQTAKREKKGVWACPKPFDQ